MKKTISLLSALFLSSIWLGAAPMVGAAELVIREAASLSLHCHTQFPDVRADELSPDRLVFDENAGNVGDFYGSCDHDLDRADEIQRQITLERHHRVR